MSTVTRPHRPLSQVIGVPPIREVHAPAWFNRLPTWLTTGGIVVVLMAISLVLRTRQLSGQLWFNEGIAVGVAQHSFADVFGLVRDAGGSPLYYLLLHFWATTVGSSAADVHWLSELFALLAIPAAMWVGQSLGGRRAGVFAAILFAFSAYMTQFAEEAQPYELLVLLSLLTTAGFVHGFVYRRRAYLWLFVAGLEAMLYTQLSAGLYAFGAACALVLVWWAALPQARAGVLRDAALCFAVVALLYVPWLPTTIHQIGHATSPWHYTPLIGAALPSQITGGDRVDVVQGGKNRPRVRQSVREAR